MTPAPRPGGPSIRDAAPRVLALAGPIILANLTQPLLSAVDAAIAGHMPDAAALGGVALGGVLFNMLFWPFGFLRMGTTGLVAQAYGAGDAAGMRTALAQALLVALALGIGLLALQVPLVAAAVTLLGGSPAVQAGASAYASARIWSAPASLGNYVVLGYLLGRQRAGQALALQIVINLANVALALLFVYGARAGIAGLGAATAASDWLGLGAGVAMLSPGLFQGMPPLSAPYLLAAAPFRRLLAVNRDIFVRTLCLIAAFAWFSREGAALGDAILAANALLLSLMSLTAYALDGFAQAAESLVGDAVGRRNRRAFRLWMGAALAWSLAGASVFSLVYAVAGDPLVKALTDKPDIRSAADAFLGWAVAAPLVSVWCYLLDGVFIGATKTREMRNGAALSLVFYLGAVAALRPSFGNHGLWASLMLLQVTRAAFLAAWLGRIERDLDLPQRVAAECPARMPTT